MERLTIPDVIVDEKTTRRTIIDASKVKEHAMKFYWRLKSVEDILGDDYNLDHLQELVESVRAERCFILPVLPHLLPGMRCSECFILLDSGEIVPDNVCSILIGQDGNGKVSMLFDTFDNGYFMSDDIGKRIFWKLEDAQKAAAALKGGQDA